MSVTTINLTKTIAVSLKPEDGSNKVNIFTHVLPTLTELGLSSDYKVLACNLIIKDLKLYTAIKSLPLAPIPDLQLTDSDTEKILKLVENENRAYRYQVSLSLNYNNNNYAIGSLSIINTQGYRYRYYNLIDVIEGALELSKGFSLQISQQNVGYGYIKSNDLLNIIGHCILEVIVLTPDVVNTINTGGNTGVNNTSTWGNLTQEQWANLTQQQWSNL